MGYHMQTVFLLDGGCDGNGAGTAADTLPLHQTVAYLAVHIFTAVCGDIHVSGFELPETLDGAEQVLRARPLQRRKHLEREGCSLFAVDDICYVHVLTTGISVVQ